jgi:hemolysin activation/secretion protein
VRRLVRTQTRSDLFELRASLVPLQTARASLRLTAAFGVNDVVERDDFGTNYDDHLRTATLKADASLQDDLGGWNYLTLLGRQGIGAFGASRDGDPMLSRFGASGDFSLIDYTFTRYQKLTDAWSIRGSVTGQWASAPLLLSQQFQLGGAAFGPGYFSGDHGVAGSAELRFDQDLKGNAFDRVLKGYQLYTFVEGGKVWDVDRLPGASASIASVGGGVRFYLGGDTRAGLAVATPVHYRPNDGSVRDLRVMLSLSNVLKLCPERPRAACE